MLLFEISFNDLKLLESLVRVTTVETLATSEDDGTSISVVFKIVALSKVCVSIAAFEDVETSIKLERV